MTPLYPFSRPFGLTPRALLMKMRTLGVAFALGVAALPAVAASPASGGGVLLPPALMSAASDAAASGAAGCLRRASLMLADGNVAGCAAQLDMMRSFAPTAHEQAEGELLRALAELHSAGGGNAEALLREWLASNPASPVREYALAAVGDYYFGRGEYASALEAYGRVRDAALDGESRYEVLYRRAYSALMLAEITTARTLFEQLRSSAAYGSAACYYLGYIDYAESDYTGAERMFGMVEGVPELEATVPYYYAQALFAQGKWEAALAMARKALKQQVPEFTAEACRVAGESLFNLDRPEEAADYLERYLKLTAEPTASALYIAGVADYKRGRYDSAIRSLSHAAAFNDAMGQSANLILGQCYVHTGATDAALMAFERAYKAGHDRRVAEEALYNYAVAKSKGGRVPFGNSVALFESFIRQYPDSRYASEVQDYIVNGYITDGNYEGALRAIDGMSRPGANALAAKQTALFALGRRDYAAGKWVEALDRFDKASAVRTSDPSIARQCALWRGNCLYELGRYDRAAQAFEAYLKSAPRTDANRQLAQYNLAYCLFAEGSYDLALKQLRNLIAAHPADNSMLADAYNRAADCLYYASDFAGAASYYDKSLELNPQAGDYATFQKALMRGLQRDYRGKIDGIDWLMESYPSSGLLPAAMLEKAESYTALGDTRSAITTYSELVDRFGSTPSGRKGLLQLAITLQSGGRTDEALQAYRRVVRDYPTSEEARLAADDMRRIHADRGDLRSYTDFMASVPDAPQTDPSELDALAFRAAEADYLNNDRTERLQAYLNDYPGGVHEAQAQLLLAQAAYAAGRTDEAMRLASAVTDRHPDSEAAPDALLIRAEAEQQLGMGERAMESFRTLESRASGPATLRAARLGLMRTAAALGRNAEALEAADRLLASTAAADAADATDEIRFTRARALAGLGRTDEAMEAWRSLAANPTALYGSMSAVSLAETMLTRGDAAGARRVADEFINAEPPHPYWLARGFIVLSDALRAEGDTFQADQYLQSLRENYPGTDAEIFEMIDSRLTTKQ